MKLLCILDSAPILQQRIGHIVAIQIDLGFTPFGGEHWRYELSTSKTHQIFWFPCEGVVQLVIGFGMELELAQARHHHL